MLRSTRRKRSSAQRKPQTAFLSCRDEGSSAQRKPQIITRTLTMVGNEDDQYVLAMLLPWHMPWSEEEQGMPFWNWFQWVFSGYDSRDLWNFMGDAPYLFQQDEYVTAYPTKANSHPLMKHEKGIDEALVKLPDAFPYHPSACIKLILRNVQASGTTWPRVIFQESPTPDKLWCAVQTKWLALAGLSARRDSMMRNHPDTLPEVLAAAPAVVHYLLEFVDTNLTKLREELRATAGGKGSAGGGPTTTRTVRR